MENQATKLKSAIETATSEKLEAADEQLLVKACDAIKTRGDLPKEAIKIIKQRLQCQNDKIIFLCLELLEIATFYCDLPFQNQIATKDFLQQINSLLLLRNLPSNLIDKLLQLLSLWNRVFSVQRDILPQFFTYFNNLKIKKPDLIFPPAYESQYEKYSNKKYAAVQAPIEGTKSIKPQEPASKTSKLTKELELIRDNIILTNSIIDEHDPSENVRHNGALTDLHYQLKEGEKKLQAIITDYTFQDENILNFCLELNDDVNKTFDRYNLLIKGRKPNPYNPSVSLKKEEPKTISEAPKIQPPNAFQKIDQPPKTQQQQQQEQIIKPQAKVFNLLDDEDDLFAQAPSTQQNNQKQDQNQEQFQFQQAPIQQQAPLQQQAPIIQAPIQQAPLVYPQQHSISNAMSSLYINQPNQQIPSIAQPNFNQIPAQQMPQYIQQPQYPGMPMNNMGMMNVIPPVMQMQPMQPGIQQQQMTGVPIQYSMNQQSQGQVKQYGLDEIKNQQKKPFDQIDDLFGLDSKPARNTK